MIRRASIDVLVLPRTQGFFCVDCPKLFPLAPRPQPSPAPGTKKRAMGPLTAKAVLNQRRNKLKRSADIVKQRRDGAAEKRARGERVKWSYRGPPTDKVHATRQTQNVGPAFDGSQGVDSQDIINIPEYVLCPSTWRLYSLLVHSIGFSTLCDALLAFDWMLF